MATEEKIIDIVQKLFKQAESEEQLGNEGAAINFAEKAKELLAKYKIDSSKIKTEEEQFIYIAPSVGATVISDPFKRANAQTSDRKVWYEELAKVVANGYYCIAEPYKSGEIIFYGFSIDREIAIYVFEKLANRAFECCAKERLLAKKLVGRPNAIKMGSKEIVEYPKVWMGDDVFRNSFHLGYREAISEKNEDSTKASIEVLEYQKENSKYRDYGNSDLEINEIVRETGKRYGMRSTKVLNGNNSNLDKSSSLQKGAKIDSQQAGDVYVLVDTSRSMAYQRLAEAQKGAIGFASDSIPRGYHIGLISFDDSAKHLISPTNNLEKFVEKVNSLKIGGSTNMKDGINAARMYFKSRRIKRTILIITDGQPYCWNSHSSEREEELTLEIANECKRDGIVIMAIGTAGCNQSFLDKLVSISGMGILTDGNGFQIGIRRMAGFLGTGV